jgi:hypothetical protein
VDGWEPGFLYAWLSVDDDFCRVAKGVVEVNVTGDVSTVSLDNLRFQTPK